MAVLSYSTDPHYLIRFSDFHSKSRLLQELSDLSYQRSSNGRDIGGAMRFVARNTFKRTLQSPNVRKVAVFFSHGRSSDPVSINTAVLEFHALDILPMVFAFKNLPEVNRAFAVRRLCFLLRFQHPWGLHIVNEQEPKHRHPLNTLFLPLPLSFPKHLWRTGGPSRAEGNAKGVGENTGRKFLNVCGSILYYYYRLFNVNNSLA